MFQKYNKKYCLRVTSFSTRSFSVLFPVSTFRVLDWSSMFVRRVHLSRPVDIGRHFNTDVNSRQMLILARHHYPWTQFLPDANSRRMKFDFTAVKSGTSVPSLKNVCTIFCDILKHITLSTSIKAC